MRPKIFILELFVSQCLSFFFLYIFNIIFTNFNIFTLTNLKEIRKKK